MKKEKFRSIESQEIVFPTPSGSIKLSTDQAGKITIGALTAPGVSEALVIDPINNEIFTSKIKFADGSSFDSAINLDDINIESAQVFLLKTNKIFFKYDTNGNPLPDQVITLKFDTSNIIDVNPSNISFVPAIEEPLILSGEGNTRTITVEQFELFNSNEVEISVTIGGITDSVTIYKVQDGVTYLQGGLSNPATFLQSTYDSSGNIFIENLSEILSLQGGKFYVFKDGQDVTNDPRITYRESTDDATTEGLTVSIDSDTGVYTITSFDPTKEIASATFEAVDSLSDQVLQSRYTISVVKQGIEGPEGPAGANGASGLDAKTVSISYTDGQIAYDSEGKNPVTNKKDENQNYIIEIEAEESSNHTSPVVYEFLVTEPGEAQATLQKGSSSKLILSNNTRTYTNSNFNTGYKFIDDTKDAFGGGKIITVRTYENGSATPSAQDQTKIIATKDGSDSLTINLENASHSYPANPNSEGKFVVSQYTGGGSIVEVYFGNEELVGNRTAQTTEELQNGEFRVEIIDEDNIAAATVFETKTKTINGTSVQYFYTGDPSNFGIDADVASITYLIVGKSSTGSVKSGLAKISYTKSKKGDKGETGSSGSSVKAVKLTSNDYQIAYSTNGTNPNPSSITLTAAASNHVGTVTYKFYKSINGQETEISSGTSSSYTTSGDHIIPTTKFSKIVYIVKTFEGSTQIASDSITVFATKDGEGAVTVIVPNNNHTFNADSEGNVTSFAGGGSEIQVYFGNKECKGTIANSLTENFSFRVSGVAASNITFPNTSISTIENSNSLKLVDPTALQGSNGTATLSIEVRADSSTTQTFTQVCSYNKSQDGKTALDEQIYSFSKSTEINSIKRAIGWKSASTTNTTTATDSYRNYKGDFTYSLNGKIVESSEASYGGTLLTLKGDEDPNVHIFTDFIPVNTNIVYQIKRRFKSNSGDFRMYIGFFTENKTWARNSIFAADKTNNWREDSILITGVQTNTSEVNNLANGMTTYFARENNNQQIKYIRLFMWGNNFSSEAELAYIDYFSIKEAKADLDGIGGLPGSQLTKERSGFYFTETGKLKIGLDKFTTTIYQTESQNYDSESDIDITVTEQVPDIRFTRIHWPNNSNLVSNTHSDIEITNLHFGGWNGSIYRIAVEDEGGWRGSWTSRKTKQYSTRSKITGLSSYYGGGKLQFSTAPNDVWVTYQDYPSLSSQAGTYNGHQYTVPLKTPTEPLVRMTIDYSGYVGINTTSPTEFLHVVGKVKATSGVVNFTGKHKLRLIADEYESDNLLGKIVSSSGSYFISISLDESLPDIEISNKRNEKRSIGVISEVEINEEETFAYVNSLGEGGIWITNINGNLENGDYITTCEIPGYGMKQDDDLLHNYTVAKITCDCDFDLQSPIYICEEFEWEGQTYRRAFVGCTYHCG